MKKRLYGFILPILICALMPLGATAEFPIVLNADRDNLNVQPGDTVTFTAEVRENGNPVSGQTVTFRVDPDDGGVSLSTTSATTDSNGQAQTTVTTGSDSSRAYWVVAAIGNKSAARLLNVAIPLPPPPPRNLSMVVIHSPGSADPGKTMTFIVEVREDGSPVSTDETVTFSITSGDGNAWFGYTGTATTRSGSTGSNGRAAATIRLGKKASGSYTVTASAGSASVSVTATVKSPPPPPPIPIVRGGRLALYKNPSGTLEPGESATFTVEVTEDGNAVSGQTVTFSLNPDDGTASLSTTSATTDSSGRASTTLTLGSNPASGYAVSATDGVAQVSGTVRTTTPRSPPPPSHPIVLNADRDNLNVQPGDTVTFTAEVRENGNPVSGQTVTFRVDPDDGGVSLSTTSATTDSNGQAQTTVTTGSDSSRAYWVVAAIGNKSAARLLNVAIPLPPPPPRNLSMVVIHSPGSADPGKTMTFIVEVREDGSPVSTDETVTFSITSGDGNAWFGYTGTATTRSGSTGSNGRAAATIRLGKKASGSYTVTASAGSASVSVTATVKSPPPPPPIPIVRGGRLALYKNPSGTLEPGESATFTVEVTEDGNAVSGQTVTFSLNPDDGTASLSTTSATTDSSGRASTTLTLGSNPASGYAVSATDGVAQVSGTVRTTTPRSPPPPSHPIVLNADRDNLNVQPGDTVTFTAEVRENGNPVSGQTVTFRVDPDDGGVSLSTTSATTDSNGQAQTTVTTGSDSSRAYWVVAAIGNKSAARLLNVAIPLPPPPPRNLSMVVIHSPGSADPGKTMTFIVEVREDGSPVSTDETVTFSITSGDGNAWFGYTGTATTRSGSTGSNGRAAATIRLGKKASGSYTVTASAGSASVSVTATVKSPPPPPPIPIVRGGRLALYKNPSGTLEPGESATFTVEVTEDGNAVSGQTVTFSLNPDDGTASLSTTSATTDSSGRASTTLTLGSNPASGYAVSATDGVAQVSGTVRTTTPRSPPPPSHPIVLNADRDNLNVQPGDTVTFTAEVRENGNPVSGQTVTFRVDPDDGGVSLSTTSATTDSNGQAQTTVTTGSDSSRAYWVVAAIGNKSTARLLNVATVETPPPPRDLSISVVSDPGSGDPGDPLPFTIEVQEDGTPVSGKTVTFGVRPDVGTAPLSSRSATTDSNGRATTTLTLGTDPVANTVEVSVEGVSQIVVFSAEALLPPPEPTALEIISGDNQSGVTGEALENPFVVEVRDQYGNPMEGSTVAFAVTSGGGSLSDTSMDTDADGLAQSILTLGSDPGANTVEVGVEGVSQMVVFSAEASLPPPEPTALEIISGDNQSGVTGEALENPFVVEVRDQYDAPMEGVSVTFAVTAGGGSLSDTSMDTDADGLAQSILTLGTDPGTNTVDIRVKGITETATFNAIAKLLEFNLSLPSSISLIHVPLKVRAVNGVARTIESVGDLYTALGGADTVKLLITYNRQTQRWDSYTGERSRNRSEDRTLTDDLGIIASMKTPVSVRLGGDTLGADGISSITLNPGINLVGLPLSNSAIARVSDLLTFQGIADNVAAIVVSDNGRFKTVRQANDDGDIPLTGGQAFLMTVRESMTVAISGEAWTSVSGVAAAPPIATGDIQVAGITPVLALTGSVVDSVRRFNGTNFHVIVKNLSTGSIFTGPIENTGSASSQVDYQLTVVDIEGGRAAMVGDTLEVSVSSSDASVTVQPLRYTLTAEDVKRHRIQLPALVIQEMSIETELLPNYPNPFNPETWIPYHLANPGNVQISIYNLNGALVRQLDLGHQKAGHYTNRSHAAYWDGRNGSGERVATGVYFYQFQANNVSLLRKMVILK